MAESNRHVKLAAFLAAAAAASNIYGAPAQRRAPKVSPAEVEAKKRKRKERKAERKRRREGRDG